MRHDPLFKLIGGRLPGAQQQALASQPTITQLENHVSKPEVSRIRSAMVDSFIDSDEQAPEPIILDIDGWDAPTYGDQQLSFFHGYYHQHMLFP